MSRKLSAAQSCLLTRVYYHATQTVYNSSCTPRLAAVGLDLILTLAPLTPSPPHPPLQLPPSTCGASSFTSFSLWLRQTNSPEHQPKFSSVWLYALQKLLLTTRACRHVTGGSSPTCRSLSILATKSSRWSVVLPLLLVLVDCISVLAASADTRFCSCLCCCRSRCFSSYDKQSTHTTMVCSGIM